MGGIWIWDRAACGGFSNRMYVFSSRRRHTRYWRDWSSDMCSSDLDLVYRLDPVVDVKHLPAAQDLLVYRPLDHLLVVGADVREDAAPAGGGCLDDADVPQRRKAHLHRARYRGRRERQQGHARLELLEALLVAHPEALLLVDDHEPQILRPTLPPEQGVRPVEQFTLPRSEVGQVSPPLRGGGETAQALPPHREPVEPLGEGPVVLLDEDGGRGEQHHLLARQGRLERRPDRDLGLAEAYVSAHKPVHRARRLHIRLDGGDGGGLVRVLRVREVFLQFSLPLGVVGEGEAFGGGPGGRHAQQLPGQRLDAPTPPVGDRRPAGAAELVQAGGLPADVLVQELH